MTTGASLSWHPVQAGAAGAAGTGLQEEGVIDLRSAVTCVAAGTRQPATTIGLLHTATRVPRLPRPERVPRSSPGLRRLTTAATAVAAAAAGMAGRRRARASNPRSRAATATRRQRSSTEQLADAPYLSRAWPSWPKRPWRPRRGVVMAAGDVGHKTGVVGDGRVGRSLETTEPPSSAGCPPITTARMAAAMTPAAKTRTVRRSSFGSAPRVEG